MDGAVPATVPPPHEEPRLAPSFLSRLCRVLLTGVKRLTCAAVSQRHEECKCQAMVVRAFNRSTREAEAADL